MDFLNIKLFLSNTPNLKKKLLKYGLTNFPRKQPNVDLTFHGPKSLNQFKGLAAVDHVTQAVVGSGLR